MGHHPFVSRPTISTGARLKLGAVTDVLAKLHYGPTEFDIVAVA